MKRRQGTGQRWQAASPLLITMLLGMPAGLLASPAAEPLSPPVAEARSAGTGTAEQQSLRVLTAHPVVHGLARQLLTDVEGIDLRMLAPARLPASRIPAFLAGRGLDKLLLEAADADAVLSLRSAWPDDQLYPLARRANIRVVEIDVANPVEGELPGITLRQPLAGEGGEAGRFLEQQPWQDSTNLGRMSQAIAHGLARLLPAARPMLMRNQQAIARRLQQAQAQASRQLAEAADVSVVLLSSRVQGLATALQLDVSSWMAPKDSAALPAVLGQHLKAAGVRLVLSHARPPEAVADAIAQAGAQLVLLPENAADPVSALSAAMQTVGEVLARP